MLMMVMIPCRRKLVVATWCQRDNSTTPFTPEEEKKLDFLYSEWTHPHFISINVCYSVWRAFPWRALPCCMDGWMWVDGSLDSICRGDCCFLVWTVGDASVFSASSLRVVGSRRFRA